MLLLRVAVWCCGTPHPVRRGLDVGGAGQLEATQHAAALQGQNPSGVQGHVAPSHLVKLTLMPVFRPHQVPDGATVALVPRHTKHIHHDNHDYVAGESEFILYNMRLIFLFFHIFP